MPFPTRAFLGAAAFAASLACAESPKVIVPDQAAWKSPPALPGVQGAWLVGGERQAGPYAFRVKLARGAKIPPHTHPDERTTTVLSGTILVGFGDAFDESKMVAVPAGSLYVAPAKVPHYVWARDGATEYQESGLGPTATAIIGRDRK